MRNVINTVHIERHSSKSSASPSILRRGANLALALWLLVLSTGQANAAKVLTPDHFNLQDYKGKVVYLDFWASWCGPCKFSFPYMEYLSNTFSDKDFVVVADNLDHSRASADAFLKTVNADFPIIFDQKGVLATRFNVSDMPTSVLIGRDGKVRYRHKGFLKEKEDEYTSHVLDLINQKY